MPAGIASDALFDNLEQHALVRTRRACPDDPAQRAREAALAPDYLADVVRRDLQPEDDGTSLLDRLHANRIGLVHELTGEVLQKLSQCSWP